MTALQIKKLRKKMFLTQGQFAERLGVSRRTAQGWEAETNAHVPSGLALKALRNLAKQQEVL